MAVNKKITTPEPDDRTEKAKKNYGTRRTPTVDSIDDIPKLDLDKKVQEAADKAVNEYTTYKPMNPINKQNPISLGDLNPIDPSVFTPKGEDIERPNLGSAIFDQLDEALERTKRQTKELHESIIDEAEEEAFDMGIDPVDSSRMIPDAPEGKTSSEFDDLFKDDEDNNNEEDDDDVDEDFIRSHHDATAAMKNKEEQQVEEKPVDEYEKYQDMSKTLLDDLDSEEDDIFKDDVDEDDNNDEEPETPDAPDFDDLSDEEQQKYVKEIKDQIKSNITPIKKYDLSKFKIKKKPVSISTIMKLTKAESRIADWVLPVSRRAISCSAVTGMEITKLNPSNSGRNRLNMFKDIYSIIYDHIIDNNKPDFETWLKTTPYHDLEHYYFCIYKATFGNNNFMNRECDNPKCKNAFIKDFNINDMIKYTDDDSKKLVNKIFQHDTTTKNDDIEGTLIQISDNYAVVIRMPTIWSVVIETASLSEQFLEKYADMIDIYSYIDDIFFIDSDTEELVPVDFKPVANDQTKTIANKIRVCYNVINSLSSDELSNLVGNIREMDTNNTIISYQIPECECPKCNKVIAATPATADELLFTRHQLGTIAAT